jgi:hypothetical protein
MLLDAYNNKEHLSRWVQNGGDKTLRSFGIPSIAKIESR